MRAAAAKTTAVKSLKFDLDATASGSASGASLKCTAAGELPASLRSGPLANIFKNMSAEQRRAYCAQIERQAATPRPFTVKIKGNGASQLPDRFRLAGTVGTGGISIDTEVIGISGTLYVKDPQTSVWKTLDQLGVSIDASTFTRLDPDFSVHSLDAAKSVKDLGDTTLGDTRVHHYQVELDPAKLKAELTSHPLFKDAQAQEQLQKYIDDLSKGTSRVEVWIGVSDDLVRRQVLDFKQGTVDASALVSDLTLHVQLDLHDYNSKVDVSAPATS